MDEAGTDAREGGNKRPSMGFSGMFPFLQQRASLDTDQGERLRKAGGKIKPGSSFDKQLMQTASGDLSPSDSPSAATPEGSPSPKPSWMSAAGREGALHQSWPGPNAQGTPSRGLFSKLMSKKGKKHGAASPALAGSPPLGSSPCFEDMTIGTGFRASHSAELLCPAGGTAGNGEFGCPSTPPTIKCVDAMHISDEGEFTSCYATPVGSGAMPSPASNLYPEGYGDTLDLHQLQMKFTADNESAAGLTMQQDLPDVFTPGFNKLLQQTGASMQEPGLGAAGNRYNADEPTVALLSTAQLAQAGCMQDQPALLLEPKSDTQLEPKQEMQQAVAAAAQDEGETVDNSGAEHEGGSCATEQQRIIAAAVAAAQAAGRQKQLPTQEGVPVCSSEIAVELIDTASTEADADKVSTAVAAGVMAAASNRVDAAADAAASAPSTIAELQATSPTAAAAVGVIAPKEIASTEEAEQAVAAVVTHGPEAGMASSVSQQLRHDAQNAAPPAALCYPPALEQQENKPEDTARGSEESASSSLDQQSRADDQQQHEICSSGDGQAPRAEEAAAPAADPPADCTELQTEQIADAADAVLPVMEEQQPSEPEMPLDGGSDSQHAGNVSHAAPQAAEVKVEASSIAVAQDAAVHSVPVCNTAQHGSTAHASMPAAVEALQDAAAPQLAGGAMAEDSEAADAAQEDPATVAAASSPVGACKAEAASSGGTNEPDLPNDEAVAVDVGTADDEPVAPLAEDSGNIGLDAVDEDMEGQPDEASTPKKRPEGGSSLLEPPASSDSPVQSTAAAAASTTAATLSHIRQRKASPMALVRESMPLFVADPNKAVGSPLALEGGDDSLDAQDMQQLSATGNNWAINGLSRLGTGAAAAGATRLLAHGGPQRVALGQAGVSLPCSLEPVAEASLTSDSPSPIPEESPSFAAGGTACSSSSSQYDEAISGCGDMSPLRSLQLVGGSNLPATAVQVTPAPAERGSTAIPDLGVTPCSTYSTPTMGGGPKAKDSGCTQATTPHSAVSSAVGSAIRGMPQSTGADAASNLSPGMPGLPDASPTLTLLPNMAGQCLGTTLDTPAQGADGSTPSLLDARAASPSAVYATRFTATPFRGALAALPMDAALNAPLVDSSPFNLTDSDGGMDTVCLADEAQRLAQNLAAAAGGFGTPPPAARTPAMKIKQTAVTTPGSAGGCSAAAGSPTDELRDLHVLMLTKQLAEVQKRMKELEVDNLRLREQVEIYEFEKTELNSQEEMEKQARQYAEEQLQQLQVEIQQVMQAKSAQAAQMLSMRQEFEGIQQEAQHQHEAMKQEHAALNKKLSQVQDERDQVLDRLNLLDMQLTALKSNNSDLNAAVETEQQRCAELEAALAARDRELAEAGRLQLEAQAKLEKAMEQMIAANTAKEHARQKAADEAAKMQQMMAERQQIMAEREKRLQDYQHLKQKYAQKSAALKEAEKHCQAKDAENQELMNMCDQLLQQQEAGGRATAGTGQS